MSPRRPAAADERRRESLHPPLALGDHRAPRLGEVALNGRERSRGRRGRRKPVAGEELPGRGEEDAAERLEVALDRPAELHR